MTSSFTLREQAIAHVRMTIGFMMSERQCRWQDSAAGVDALIEEAVAFADKWALIAYPDADWILLSEEWCDTAFVRLANDHHFQCTEPQGFEQCKGCGNFRSFLIDSECVDCRH
jgi:hypothetical protein